MLLGRTIRNIGDLYPMLWVALCLICGIVVADAKVLSGREAWIVGAVGLVLGSLLDLIFRRTLFLALFIVGVAGYLITSIREPSIPSGVKYDREALFVGVIGSRVEDRGKWQRADMELLAVRDSLGRWSELEAEVIGHFDTTELIALGDTIAAVARLRRVDGDYGRYLMRRGNIGKIYGYNISVLGASSGVGIFEELRDRAVAQIMELDSAQSQAAATMASMVVGRRDMLSQQSVEEYRAVGAAHLLAISGLHIGMVVVLLNLLFGWVKLFGRGGRVTFSIVIILALWFYALFSGMAVSVQRAAIMFTLYQVAVMVSRSGISINILSTAAFLVLLFEPLSIFSIGFQLSFSAMVGISIFYRPIASLLSPRYRLLRIVWGAIAVSLSAQLMVMPLIAYHFGVVQWFAVVLSTVIWLTMPLIIFSTILYLLTAISSIGLLGLWVTEVQNSLFSSIATNSWVEIECSKPPIWLLLVIYALLLTFGWWFSSYMNRRSRFRMLRRRRK